MCSQPDWTPKNFTSRQYSRIALQTPTDLHARRFAIGRNRRFPEVPAKTDCGRTKKEHRLQCEAYRLAAPQEFSLHFEHILSSLPFQPLPSNACSAFVCNCHQVETGLQKCWSRSTSHPRVPRAATAVKIPGGGPPVGLTSWASWSGFGPGTMQESREDQGFSGMKRSTDNSPELLKMLVSYWRRGAGIESPNKGFADPNSPAE